MADVSIRTRRNFSLIVALTNRGQKWLLKNIIVDKQIPAVVTIQSEYLNDFIYKLRKEGIEYDEI